MEVMNHRRNSGNNLLLRFTCPVVWLTDRLRVMWTNGSGRCRSDAVVSCALVDILTWLGAFSIYQKFITYIQQGDAGFC